MRLVQPIRILALSAFVFYTAANAQAQEPSAKVAELITALKSGSGDDQAKAAEELGKIGPTAIPAILQELRISGEKWRSWGGAAMAQMGPKAVAPMVAALKDQDPYVRLAVCTGLERMGPVAIEAVPTLAFVAQNDRDAKVRAMAKLAITGIRSRR